jgi:hypothetical protein
MENIDISANIPSLKLPEFQQSKQSFLQDLKEIDGYLGYTEIPGEDYTITIEWESRQQLDLFLESELYHFFRGAIQTLGSFYKVTIQSSRKTE